MISTLVLLKDQPTTRLSQQTPFSLERLLTQIRNVDLSNEEDKYYALSTQFIENLSIYKEGELKKDANCSLFVEQSVLRGELKEGLQEKKDFLVVTEMLLQYLWKEYDCKSVEVKRRTKYSKRWFIYKEIIEYVVLSKQINQEAKLEQIVEVKTIQMFPIATINQVYNKILLFENIDQTDVQQMWISTKKIPQSLSKSSIESSSQPKQKKKLNELQFIESNFFATSQEIFRIRKRFKNFGFVLEVNNCCTIKRADIACPRHQNKLAIMSCLCLKRKTFSCSQGCYQQNQTHKKSCIYIPYGFDDQQIQLMKIIKDRQIGLKNQSSLCYFNSIVQTVFHIKQIVDFFTKSKEQKIINYCNINGTWGEIAKQFGKTLRRYFKQPRNEEVGNQLYHIVSRWHHSFSNQNTQQDAHEMLIKLLDWLKQDLNLNQKKISYHSIETNDKDEDQIWKQVQSTQKGRNKSIIENIFQGFQKSLLECKTCNKKSINFQNFITIQLPMVGETKKQIIYKTLKIYFLPYKPQERIYRLNLSLTGDESIEEIKNCVKKIISSHYSGSFCLYKVDCFNIQLIDNANKYLLFAQDLQKPIFAIQNKPERNENDKLTLKIHFQGEQTPPFARIIYFPDFYPPSKIYLKVFNFCIKAWEKKQIANNYVNKHYSSDKFPFDLIFKNDHCVQKVQRKQQHDQVMRLTQFTQIIVKILDNPNFNFKNMNCCTELNKEGSQAKDTIRYIYSDPSIQDCISAFCKKEQINDMSWMCQNCKILRNAVKSLSFHRLPKVLIFSLNRFRKDSQRHEGFPTFIKNEKRITFKAILDMSPFIHSQQQQLYRLITVIVHVRLTRSNTNIENSSGHYYSYIRTNSGWKQFNDSFVGEVSESKVLSNQNAYILFYQKLQYKE